MKVVLDTNVFISVFFWGGNPRKVLERCIEGIDDLYSSREILAELYEVLCRPKFSLDRSRVDFFIKSIEEIAQVLPAKVDFIITGDLDLLVLKECQKVRICNPEEYSCLW